MKKRILSLILATLMSVTVLAACENGRAPVEDAENSNDQQQEINNGESDEEDIPVEPENPNIQTLDLHLPLESDPVVAENPEKVLKLTVSSEGDAPARHFIIRVDPVDIPSGCTLQYDVYLETANAGMGSFDMKINNGVFLCGDETKVDDGGIGLDVETMDLVSYAYGRWYHREIPLHNDGSVQTLSMFRFSAGGLTDGCTNICYYDNIKVVDADGNVVFEVDENTVAETEIRKTSGISGEFALVDDPAPNSARLSANGYLYKQEISQELTGHDLIELTYNLEDSYSTPAIYVGEYDDSCLFGIRGYIVTVHQNFIYLLRCEEELTEMFSQEIVGHECGKEFSLRVELNGSEIRGYFVDDMEGVEPWPEFIIGIEDMTGKNCGIMDIVSRGSYFKTLEFSELEVSSLDSYYVNPVKDSLADPDVLYYDGVYYLYGTMGPGYQVYSSTDLVNWEHRGQCLDNPGACWAPDVEYYNGKFYMACTIDRTLVIAVADSPLGPFTLDPEPLLGFITFDGHFFIDDDGQAYIYYTTNYEGRPYGIYGAKFDFETRKMDYSTEKGLLFPEEVWETYGRNGGIGGNKVVEGAYVLKHNGLYYLTYSGGAYDYKKYAVGYAVSDSPLGDFVKYEGNPIHIGNSTMHGTAHHSFTTTPDGELVIVYHQHKNLTEVEVRRTCIDKARFVPTESGIDRLETYGPTNTPQPMPLG